MPQFLVEIKAQKLVRRILNSMKLIAAEARKIPFFEKWSFFVLFVCVEVLRPSQPSGVMSSAVSLPNHTFTGQA